MEIEKAKEIYGELKKLFSKSSDVDSRYKWFYLKKFHSDYLSTYTRSPIFSSTFFSIANFLLDSLYPTLFSEKYQETIFDDIFLNSIPQDSFMILVQKLSESSPCFQQEKIINLLEQFLKKGCINKLLLDQCSKSISRNPEIIHLWTDLVTNISSLPERIANKTQGRMPKIFHPEVYFPLLVSSILKTISHINEKIGQGLITECSVEFIGNLIGKFCVLGHGDIVAKNLFGPVIKYAENDFVWRKISKNLITKLPSLSLEAFTTQLLLFVPWYGYLDWILGEEGMTNSKIQFCMTTKLVFIKYFKQELILQNIIGYYGCLEKGNMQSAFWPLFDSLVKHWTNQSSLKHQPKEQQFYLAKALVIYAGWIKDLENPTQSNVHMGKLLEGVTIRISNSEAFVRDLGMIVAHLLLPAVNPEALKFDIEGKVDDSLLKQIKDLAIIPQRSEKDNVFNINDCIFFEENQQEPKNPSVPCSDKVENAHDSADSESEDDLEPYDLSNNVHLREKKRPHYLLDCMKGLLEDKDPDWFEMCLNQAQDLIEKNSTVVHEVAEEMSKILLHLEDSFGTSSFQLLRHKTLVSLAIHCPVIVADYLTSQFYADNYNIRQRLDILEVLAVASQQLSQPKTKLPVPQEQQSRDKFLATAEKSWQVIVRERVAAKTRYFSKIPKKVEPELQENRFAAVAGHFFFPLLEKFDKQNRMLKLFDDDSYVLGRLTYTLGIIMHAATNVPMASRMGESLLQFLTSVRNSSDVFVRQACIFALASVYVSVPGYLLLSDLTAPVMESQQWLQSVIENDADANCQTRASYALATLLNIMQEQELPLVTELMQQLSAKEDLL